MCSQNVPRIAGMLLKHITLAVMYLFNKQIYRITIIVISNKINQYTYYGSLKLQDLHTFLMKNFAFVYPVRIENANSISYFSFYQP